MSRFNSNPNYHHRNPFGNSHLRPYDPSRIQELSDQAAADAKDKAEREAAVVAAEKKINALKRHMMAVMKALALMRKRRDKRKRLKKVSTKAMRTIRALKLNVKPKKGAGRDRHDQRANGISGESDSKRRDLGTNRF